MRFPPIQFLRDSITEIPKLNTLNAGGESGEAQLDLMPMVNREVKAILNKLDVVPWGFLTEGDGRFVKINLLSGGSLVNLQASFDVIIIFSISFKKDEAIINKEKMSNSGTASSYTNTLNIIM